MSENHVSGAPSDTTQCSHIYRGSRGRADYRCLRQAEPGKKRCGHCLVVQGVNRRTRRADGRCEQCSDPPVPGKYKCEKHARIACENKKAQTNRRVTNGVCIQCGGAPATCHTVCETCWFARVAKSTLGGQAAKSRGPEIRALFYAQGGMCAYTGTLLVPGVNASLDHKVPQASGGDHSLGNLQWVCLDVNFAKRALSETAFYRLCDDVLRHRDRTNRVTPEPDSC